MFLIFVKLSLVLLTYIIKEKNTGERLIASIVYYKNNECLIGNIAKKNFYSQKQNIMNNYNKDNINKEILNNNIQNNNYIRQSINKTNSIFSSTMNSLTKSKPQKKTSKNYHYEVKSKTAYPTKNNSRKQSNEKSLHYYNFYFCY